MTELFASSMVGVIGRTLYVWRGRPEKKGDRQPPGFLDGLGVASPIWDMQLGRAKQKQLELPCSLG